MKTRVCLLLIAILAAFGSSVAQARDVVEVESQYLGNGCFQYTVRTLYDPFITGLTLGQLVPVPFTNYVSNTEPPHWNTFIYQGSWDGIVYDNTVPQPRINEISFSVCSSSQSFRMETNGFFFNMQVTLADCFEDRIASGVGFTDCLVPCAPEEADGSASNLVSRLELVPDLKIDGLIRTNQDVYGLKFSWIEDSTVELQASHDLASWTNVARFFGDPPQTTWTTNSPISAFGEFFRLRMIAADRHDTNALPAAIVRRAPLPISRSPLPHDPF